MINPVNSQLPFNSKADMSNSLSFAHPKDASKAAAAGANMDTVTLLQSESPPTTYSSSFSPDELAEKGYEMLRKLVTSMLKEQGIDFVISTGSETIDISDLSQEKAQELIAEDGYFGVEQTSDRIVNFAIAAAGGDVSRLEAIKQGVEAGFTEANEIFGGKLPDISFDTLDAIMEKLDAWAVETVSVEA